MVPTRAPLALAALLLAVAVLPLAAPTGAAWAAGRNDAMIPMTGGHTIDATMWVPSGTAAGAELPALIWIHGYGGSKEVGRARQAAEHGYVGFAYSTRGFGQSTGQMDVVGPGSLQDLKELVAWLKANGPVAADKVAVAGCSYGGGHAFQAAVRPDMGIAAAIPCASWTDLQLALRPNEVFKLSYTTGFYATGEGLVQDGRQPLDQEVGGVQVGRRQLYDTYAPEVHAGYAALLAGVGDDAVDNFLRERSAALRVHDLQIPVLLVQGMNDDLFAADQVLDFFGRIPHQEKWLYLGYVGHPRAVQSGPEVAYIEGLAFKFLDYYLKGQGSRPFDLATPVRVAATPWDGAPIDLPAWPGDRGAPLAFNGDGVLGGAPAAASLGMLVNTAVAGIPDDAAAQLVSPALADAPSGTPLDTLTFRTPVLAQAQVLLGTPRAELSLRATAGASYQVAVKVFDIAPGGEATLVTRGVFGVPENIPGPTQRLLFDLQPYHYTFAAGHAIEVRVASSDFPAYMPEKTPFALAFDLGAGGSVVRLPLRNA